MAKKRERFDVIKDILATIRHNQNKIRPTRLLQLSNLSPKMFKDYINELLETGLIEQNDSKDKKFYSLTEKGDKFLEKYRVFKDFIDNLGL